MAYLHRDGPITLNEVYAYAYASVIWVLDISTEQRSAGFLFETGALSVPTAARRALIPPPATPIPPSSFNSINEEPVPSPRVDSLHATEDDRIDAIRAMRRRTTNEVYRIIVKCRKEGKKNTQSKEKYKGIHTSRTREGSSCKTGCPYKAELSVQPDGQWLFHTVYTEHNHGPINSHALPQVRMNISVEKHVQIVNLHASGLRPLQIKEALLHIEDGDSCKLTLVKPYIHNAAIVLMAREIQKLDRRSGRRPEKACTGHIIKAFGWSSGINSTTRNRSEFEYPTQSFTPEPTVISSTNNPVDLDEESDSSDVGSAPAPAPGVFQPLPPTDIEPPSSIFRAPPAATIRQSNAFSQRYFER
ncbi:hypothetical protein HYFRA_00005119 [Hymenoscyphus fraxineus]|uniref:FAR1 domain-containing protein n=1 Tax=Hymenoscyphus fraxineus TaxID=746836 RepID=A0A9N9PW45_9HELO|nr:hypothetical protein HYFRA_00005119 [Hymenoscyphus fraxineus]